MGTVGVEMAIHTDTPATSPLYFYEKEACTILQDGQQVVRSF